jgi:hypothetical protein
MNNTKQILAKQQLFYTEKILNIYDFLVLGFLNRFVWKCPTQYMVNHYNKHISTNHLDVGVGTGYFLDNCVFPSDNPRIALLDINQAPLNFVFKRISRYEPEIYQHNILDSLNLISSRFDSIGINYLLHCIPGTIESKSIIFDNLKALLNNNGVIFGTTLLQSGVFLDGHAKKLTRLYNEKGIFSNNFDSLTGLVKELMKRFQDISIEVIGCAALFSGRIKNSL